MAATLIMMVGAHPLVEINWKDERGQCRKQLSENFTLGRGVECEISFDDPMVSRKHAAVTFEAGHWWIEDQGSANGTWVDGKRVQKAELAKRCEVRLSDTSPLMVIEIQSLSATTMILET